MEHTGAQLPPTRALTTPTGEADSIPAQTSIRVFENGQVLVSDTRTGWLALYDSTLRSRRMIAEGVPPARGAAPQALLLPFMGDTALVADVASGSFRVVDNAGNILRVIAIPRMQDAGFMNQYYKASVDPQGRVVYRATLRPTMGPGGMIMADSAPIVRTSFETRTPDTVAFMRIAVERPGLPGVDSAGNRIVTYTLSPATAEDDWALLADGTIAIVRQQDFHIDWIGPDGSKRSSPKVAWPWKRLTDEDKQRVLDAFEPFRRRRDSLAAESFAAGPARPGAPNPVRSVYVMAPASEVPDYPAPFAAGQSKGDRQGRLWVREQAINSAGQMSWLSVYTVFDREGNIVDRVSLPDNVSIVAFGPNETIYCLAPKSPTHLRLVRFSYATK